MSRKKWLVELFGILFAYHVLAAPPRDLILPPMQFDYLNIKTPQLIGILLGCGVFTVTISVVIYLLYLSGSFSKLAEELSNGAAVKLKASLPPNLTTGPELYDFLLEARMKLPLKPILPLLDCKESPVFVKRYDPALDEDSIIDACNGKAQYNGSDYDPSTMWMWLANHIDNREDSNYADTSFPLKHLYESKDAPPNSSHLVIADKQLQKQIGMISLVDNSPVNLSIRIGGFN